MANKTTKHRIDDLKQFLAREIPNKLTQKLQEVSRKVCEATKLIEDNKRQTYYVVQERDSFNTKV